MPTNKRQKKKSPARSNRIQVYVGDDTKVLLHKAAAIQRRRISNFVELLIEDHCRKIIADAQTNS